MKGNKFNTGDYVKWKAVSKGGIKYYERGMITHISRNQFYEDRNGYINYDIINDEGEEIKRFQMQLESDVKSEREAKLNRLFNDEEE